MHPVPNRCYHVAHHVVKKIQQKNISISTNRSEKYTKKNKMIRHIIPWLAWVVPDFLTSEKCERFIEIAENCGYNRKDDMVKK